MPTRVTHRPRRYTSPTMLRLATPLLVYDARRRAYRLRVVGARYGPTMRPDRRRGHAEYAGRERRRTGRPLAGSPGAAEPTQLRQLAVIGAVAGLAVIVGIGITLLPVQSSSRAASTPPRAVVHGTESRSSRAAGASGTSAAAARTGAAHRSGIGRARHHPSARAAHRGPRAPGHRHAAARHSPARGSRASARARTTTTRSTPTTIPPPAAPVNTTSAPVGTTTAPVPTTPAPAPAPVHTTPVHTTPTPVTTTPSSGSSGSGTSGSGGTTTSGGSGGSGKVSGGG